MKAIHREPYCICNTIYKKLWQKKLFKYIFETNVIFKNPLFGTKLNSSVLIKMYFDTPVLIIII